jgi:hypothetical protein
MAAHKSHHYVPQFYMRLFSGTAAERVGVFIIAKERFIPKAPIKGQACKDYFYGTDRHAEETFGAIENATAPILKSIVGGALPGPGSPDYHALMLYLAVQHSRTLEAEAQLAEGSEHTIRAMLRTKFELEGNEEMLHGLELVRIKRNNAIGEAVMAGTIGAMLLTDLALLLVQNDSDLPFIASDAPVVPHNRLFEATRSVGTAGYANVGLQLFLPLGPRLLLQCYDPAAYAPVDAAAGVVRFDDRATARLLNDLQWEAAGKVILTSPAMGQAELHSAATRWRLQRGGPRMIHRQEIVSRTDTEVRVRQGVGPKPSDIALDLPFLAQTMPSPPPLGPYEVAPSRDLDRDAMVREAWEDMMDLADRIHPAPPR